MADEQVSHIAGLCSLGISCSDNKRNRCHGAGSKNTYRKDGLRNDTPKKGVRKAFTMSYRCLAKVWKIAKWQSTPDRDLASKNAYYINSFYLCLHLHLLGSF